MNLTNFTIEDAYSFTEPLEPHYWKRHDLTVLRDGYLTCGTRIHVIKEQWHKSPCMLNNTIVISDDVEMSFK